MGAAPPSPAELLAELRRRPWRPGVEQGADLTSRLNGLLEALDGGGRPRSRPPGEALLDETLDLLGDGRLDGALTTDLDVGRLASIGEALAAALAAGGGASDAARSRAYAWLDAVRRPPALRAVHAASATGAFMDAILRVVDASRFTVARLLDQRARRYGPRTLFREARAGLDRQHSFFEVAGEVDRLALGLLALERQHGPGPVAVLSENRYEMALVDLACLTSGVVDVMVPSNATDSDVAYILGATKARIAVVSTAAQLRRVELARGDLAELREVVLLDAPAPRGPRVLRLGDVVARGAGLGRRALAERREAIGLDDLATVMFTSGTTGRPKGICFSQRSIVSKRFARALALPDVGDQDVFLCYLPLCHTFGRYLEMLGCLFWGATYVFLEDPSTEALLAGLRRVRPTVFISIPKRWLQLFEEAGRRADLERGGDEEIGRAVREVVGDRLRFGLSAAGYLDPEIFRFFQRHGVELMSGFGMTEATGGITMTPPGGYRDDSLGVPLPGVETRLAEDGELLVRGPYVTGGYFGSAPGEGFTEDGWLRTGDLMERDDAGHFRLVDRKKEIYKNIKGESVAPQRIEHLFRDFEAVKRVFLVGDHRPYNTALFVPNPDYREVDLAALDEVGRRDVFHSFVVSVNRFLAPYERIVDFAVLDRDFEEARGELTPKGTYRRKAVVRSFAGVIDGLYRRAHLRLPGLDADVRLPNWIFQALGLTAREVRIDGNVIALARGGHPLIVQHAGEAAEGTIVRVGACRYLLRQRVLDLGDLLSTPALWLGNEDLVRFAPLEPSLRTRRERAGRDVALLGRAVAYVLDEGDRGRLEERAARPDQELDDLDLAARVLGSDEEEAALLAVRLIERALAGEEGPLGEPARLALRSAADAPSAAVRREALRVLLPAEREGQVAATLERFLGPPGALLDEEAIARLCGEDLAPATLKALVQYVHDAAVRRAAEVAEPRARRAWVSSLLATLAEYGAAHPGQYRDMRAALTRVEAFAPDAEVVAAATEALTRLREGFRGWLGEAQTLAVDPEDGREYRWDDVVTFEEGIDPADQRRLMQALTESGFLREAVFLLSPGAMVRLSDIAPGGVWVSLLGVKHGKAVYRITVHTRHQGSFDVAANLNRSLSHEEVAAEIQSLIVTGQTAGRKPLVEAFGGHWSAHDLWSEEFVAGETLDRAVRRLAHERDGGDRLQNIWSFLVWTAATAYLRFWKRADGRIVIGDPGPENVIVPTHDYQSWPRLVAIAHREPFRGVVAMLAVLWRDLVEAAEKTHPGLAGHASPEVLFSALLDVVGVEEGTKLLGDAEGWEPPFAGRAGPYLRRVREDGFVSRRLHFAIERYRRWEALARDATPQARAATLLDLFDTYDLGNLLGEFPDARVRLFRDTVLRGAATEVVVGLGEIMRTLRSRRVEAEEALALYGDLRRHMTAGSDEEYFLARLTFPHLRPGDQAGFLSTERGGVRQTDVVVTLEDHEGRPFQVRHPISPKEVARLHKLFLGARLEVRFGPEHQYLVALSDRGQIVGGLYYLADAETESAHLEKIVVGERFRKLGVSDGLMNEFFKRLRAAGIKRVTTGYFRPGYFYRFGFAVEKRHAGLVKEL